MAMPKRTIEDGWQTATPDEAEEKGRLSALHAYDILDTPQETEFERITTLVAEMLDVPIALVSLIDENRQWFKSCYGLNVAETPRDMAFCVHAIETPEDIMIIPDARKDNRFRKNPLVTGEPHIRFYAGAPLITKTGFALGTLCAISNEPREGLTNKEKLLMQTLAAVIVDEMELRVKTAKLEKKLRS